MIAFTAYLKGRCHMSYTTLRDFYRDVFSIKVSTGFLVKQIRKVSNALKKPYGPVIKQSLCFSDIWLQEIGPLSLLEGSGGQYVVPSTFQYIAQFEWELDQDLPPLRHVDLRVLHGL